MERMSDEELLDFYRDQLIEDVTPFWMRHGVDREFGGLTTCMSDDGSLISHDKYMWSQLRGLWTFSKLYNRIEARDEWLDAATGIYDFVSRFGRDENGEWVFLVDRRGKVKEGATSIYADGFARYGLTEYARATGSEEAKALARETCAGVRARLAKPGSYTSAPYEIPEGAKAHGIRMIFSLVFHELGKLLEDAEIASAGLDLAVEVLDCFRRPERRAILEFIGLDDRPRPDTNWGRCVVPGHAIESMWFMIHIFRDIGDSQRISQAVEAIRWHIEKGWDPEYGGILLGIDVDGKEPIYWANWDKKSWWQHTEALYALLLAREYTDASWPEEWYWKVHEYAFARFPRPEFGEWTQRLDRKGDPIADVIALPVKDPFHLPRALIYIIDHLERRTGLEPET